VGKDKVCVGCQASGKPIRARGLCGACYQSWRLHKRAEEEKAAADGLEVDQALRALLAEVDPFQAPLVADLAPLQVVAALRKAHMDTVARWADKAERLTEERAAEFRQLTSQQEALVGTVKELRARSGDGGNALQADVDVALDLLRWATTTVTQRKARRAAPKARVVEALVMSAIDALKGKA